MNPIPAPKIVPLSKDDARVREPLFNIREAALYLDIPPSTFLRWATPSPDGRSQQGMRSALVYVLDDLGREPRVPFVGLAEGYVLRAFREAGVALQRIRPALARLEHEMGVPYALASGRLYTDGSEVLFDYAEATSPELYQALTVVRSGQNVFNTVIQQYLQRITFDSQQWPEVISLPAYREANVIVDVHRAFGRPLLLSGFGARVEDVIDRWQAGESIDSVANDFGLTVLECDELIRVAFNQRKAA